MSYCLVHEYLVASLVQGQNILDLFTVFLYSSVLRNCFVKFSLICFTPISFTVFMYVMHIIHNV